MILSEVPNANVDGKPGRTTSFEVTINGKCVFSKLEAKAFPVFEKVKQIV
jgi:selT/selW/selH-like putative selenoprotein